MEVIDSKVEVLPRRVGRPSSYESWMAEDLIDCGKQGYFVSEVCSQLGIKSYATFYKWIEEIEEFKEAFEMYHVHFMAFYEAQLRKGIISEMPKSCFNYLALVLNNKSRGEYRRNADAAGGTTNISVGNVNIANIKNLDSIQLDAQIEALTEELKRLEHKDVIQKIDDGVS